MKTLRVCAYAVAVAALLACPAAVNAQVEPQANPVLAATNGDEVAPPPDQAQPSTPTTSPPSKAPTEKETPAPSDEEGTENTPSTTPPPPPTPKEAESPTPAAIPTPPTAAPTPAPVPSPTPTTSSPSIRTDTATNNDSHGAHGGAPQRVNPLLFVGFAVICTLFLALWSRRRRGTDADASVMSGMATTSSSEGGGGAVEPKLKSKVQYSRIENRPEEPFDVDDVDDDAEFGGGHWDDWEGDAPDAMDEDEGRIDAGKARLTQGLSSSSSSTPATAPRSNTNNSVRPQPHAPAQIAIHIDGAPAPASAPASQSHADRLKDLVLAEASGSKAASTSAASNSSTDSFEIVPPSPVDLLSGPGPLAHSPAKFAATAADTAAATVEDDLFSQFGMVPTFKNGVQQPLAPAARPSFTASAASTSPFSTATATTTAAATAALSASSLFAADLEDIAVAAAAEASDEWGEDDDWAQGI